MFCPNCGTSNEDTTPRCKQCGFELQQAKPAAPKFKGTMLLGQSPFAGQPAGDGAKADGAKAGAETPAGAAAAKPAATGASRAALKGTMVGVAPPGVGSPTPPGQAAPGQAAGVGEQRPAQPKPAMKGTMIGLAPPAVGGPAVGGAGATGTGAPAPAGPQAGQSAAGAPTAGTRQIPSKLKGTMIGVAPPSLGGQGTEGTAPTMVMPSQAPATPGSPNPGSPNPGSPNPGSPDPGSPGTAGAAPAAGPGAGGAVPSPGLARTEAIPAMAASTSVNPLGGTVLGSPAPDFGAPTAQIPSAQLPGAQPPAAQGSGGQGSGSQAFAQTALSQAAPIPADPPGTAANPGPMQSFGDAPLPGGTLVVPAPPIAAALEASAHAASAHAAGAIPAGPGAITPAPGGPSAGGLAPSGARGPLGKVRNPVATLLLGMMCFVYALVAYIQMLGELKSFRQKNDLSLLLFFIPIINIIEVLKLPEKVADAQRMVGVQNPQVAHPVLYLFFGLYFFPADLNEVWEAARRNQG